MIGLPGVGARPLSRRTLERNADHMGELPSLAHQFKRYDDHRDTVYTAEQVVNDVENRCHSRVEPLPLILLRKGIITGEEFLEAVHARDFTLAD